MYFLGIDVNTYRVEAAALDSKTGKVLSVSEAFLPLSGRAKPSQVQARHVWEKVKEVVARLLRESRLKSDDIAAIAVTSAQDAWVPVGYNFEPLYPLVNIQVNPFETRSVASPAELSAQELFRINGRGERQLSGVHNLLWFAQNERDLLARTYKWLNLSEFISARMADSIAVDAGQASRYGVLDINTRQWSQSLVSAYGINADLLPRVEEPGFVIGKLTRRAAGEMSLPEGTPVVVASSGPSCAGMACCIPQCGCLNLITENELILTALPRERAFEVDPTQGYTLEPHINGVDFLCIGVMPFAIPAILWVVENFFPHLADRPISEIYASLQAKLEVVPVGSEGLVFLPHLIGSGTPKADSTSRGAIVGLRPNHSKWHVYRAALEGIAYELRQNLAAISKATGRDCAEIGAFGWGAENRVALQIKADVTGVPFSAGASLGGPACGAAHLAAKALGFKELKDQYCSASARYRSTYQPDRERKSRYNLEYTKLYADLYPTLLPAFAKLS